MYSRHYCYRIDFADGYVYFGVRTCRCSIAADSSYTGSPKTHAAKWLTDTPRVKTVVSVHATRELAQIAEDALILDFWAVSKPLSLNASTRGAKFNTLGIKHADKARAKMSAAAIGRRLNVDTRAKIGAAGKGKKWYTNGISSVQLKPSDIIPEGFVLGRPEVSKEARSNQSAARRGKKLKPPTDEARAKIGAAGKGKKWYTNGIISRRLGVYDDVPEGFVQGRPSTTDETRTKLSKAMKDKPGNKWYTDEATSILLKPSDKVPEGFKPGRTLHPRKQM